MLACVGPLPEPLAASTGQNWELSWHARGGAGCILWRLEPIALLPAPVLCAPALVWGGRAYKGGELIWQRALWITANFSHMLGFDDPNFYELMRLYAHHPHVSHSRQGPSGCVATHAPVTDHPHVSRSRAPADALLGGTLAG